MVLRHALLAAVIGGVAAVATAQAQTTPPTAPGQSSSRDSGMTASRSVPTTESTGDFNAKGELSANAFIGAKVKNDAKETVGSVSDLYLDGEGNVKTVVMSVGGFLGVGSKDVAVKWSDLKHGRDGKSLALTTSLSKDDLKALPDYKNERQQPSQAAAPATGPATAPAAGPKTK
jgi:hypothetical protein